MMSARTLGEYLEATTERLPAARAVVDPDGRSLTYEELNDRSSRLAGFLRGRGVRRGDRVGLVLPKSIEAVIAVFGVMKAGAAYVPVDFSAPHERGRRILADCQVRAAIVDGRSLDVVPESSNPPLAATVVVGSTPDHEKADGLTPFDEATAAGERVLPDRDAAKDALAYILYTSGSTGMPKGVMLTHENAVSFVDWCSSVFAPTSTDRFSSHAPFHFDLSVLDIFVSIKHGATLFLISEDLGKSPKELAQFIAAHQLTVWYSTPSILTLLAQFGHLAAQDCSSLRLVLFAGEVFPVKHLRALQQLWPQPTYYNLYGPTETNVCTFAHIPASIPDDRSVPYGIGAVCSHCESLVLDPDGHRVPAGEEGLLYISGPSVFSGYWNRPVENARAFLLRGGKRWYNTGDVVRWDTDEGFVYVGRRDRMVKRRGYRIELGEIERALYLHPDIREAAVVAVADGDAGVRIVAFVSSHASSVPSIIALKTFCVEKLPAYMSPDRFVMQPQLPRTSTDKVDYQALRQQAS